MCLGEDFFHWICLGTCELHELEWANLAADFEVFSHYFFKEPFCLFLPFFSFCDSLICRFLFLVVFQNSHKQSLFFLILLWLDNFKVLFFCSQILLLDPFWCWCYLLYFFILFIAFFSSGISAGLSFFVCVISISVKCLILFVYCFLSLMGFFCMYFLVAHWASFKQIFWILSQVNGRSPCFWGELLEYYCFPLVVSCLLDFQCSLKFYVAVFSFEVEVPSSSLYWLISGEK